MRHGGHLQLRTVPVLSGQQHLTVSGEPEHRIRWKEARNGLPPLRPYEWNGYPDLSATRRAAAARCGLSKYPAELIELSEYLEDGWGHLPVPERRRTAKRYRRLLLAAQREQAASERGAA